MESSLATEPDLPSTIGELIPDRFSTPAPPESPSTSEPGPDLELLALEELRSNPEIAKAASLDPNSLDTFPGLVTAIVQHTRFRRPKAYGFAAKLAPEAHECFQRHLQSEVSERELAAEAARKQERLAHLENTIWPQKAGRFAGCRLEHLKPHGKKEQQETQKRVWKALCDLDIDEFFASGKNLLFIGPPGGGKTHLMFSLAWKLLHRLDGKIVARNGAALRTEMKRASFESPDKEKALLQELTLAPLLLLDDPVPTGGKELTDFQADCLYQITDQRWVNNRPIWATLNLPIDKTREAAESAITAPVWDRLKDGATVVSCNWESYRKPERTIS